MTGMGHTLLIVDDDVDVRETLAELLANEGYSVLTAAHGAEALALLRDGGPVPCVILLDLMMPVMNGYEFRASQRVDAQLASIPVFVFSAGERHEERALDATAFLRKPLDVDALLTALAQHC